MPEPWRMEQEKKIWLPKGSSDSSQDKRRDESFRAELTRMAELHRVGVMVIVYVNHDNPRDGKVMIVGQPTSKFLDAAWQRIRLFASDLITTGKVK
jgi:hypothetical protein